MSSADDGCFIILSGQLLNFFADLLLNEKVITEEPGMNFASLTIIRCHLDVHVFHYIFNVGRSSEGYDYLIGVLVVNNKARG